MKKPSGIKYSIVVPVYNTTHILEKLHERIEKVFTSQVRQSYELVFVDDGSPNLHTWPVLQNLVRKNPRVSAIRLTRNFGQHAALLCGLAHAGGEYIITMDDDLQHAPEDIPRLISKQEHDVVIGQFAQKRHSWLRNIFSRTKAYFDEVLSGKPPHLRITTFCLFRRRIVEGMLAVMTHSPYPFFSSTIFFVTRDVVGVPVNHSLRQEGKSGYSMVKLLRLFSRLLLNNYRIIFQMVSLMGAFLFLLGLLVLMGLLISTLMLKNIPGWFFWGLAVVSIHGFLLFILGVLGVGLSRAIAGAEQKKPYLIRRQIFHSDAE